MGSFVLLFDTNSTIEAITTLLMAGTGWVAPNPSAQVFLTFRALLVHPKTAALFFRGIPVDMVYLWVCSLLVLFSAETLELHMPLFQFLTAAVTHEGENHGALCIQTNWKHKDPGATEELQRWYFELLAQRARLPSQPEPITIAPLAAPMGTPPISSDSVIQLANLLGAHYRPPAPTKTVPATPAEKIQPVQDHHPGRVMRFAGTPQNLARLTGRGSSGRLGPNQEHARPKFHLRAFVEGYIEESTKESPWEYSFLLTTEMLNALQGLGFAGEDAEKKWQNWMKGLLLWSLAAQNEATHQVGNEQCQGMIDFEDMASTTILETGPRNHALSSWTQRQWTIWRCSGG
jgi:hypothetical protein